MACILQGITIIPSVLNDPEEMDAAMSLYRWTLVASFSTVGIAKSVSAAIVIFAAGVITRWVSILALLRISSRRIP